MSNQSSVIKKNLPESPSGNPTKKAPPSLWLTVGGSILFVILIFVIVSIFNGNDTKKPTEKMKEQVPTTESAANGARPLKNNNEQQREVSGTLVNGNMQNTSGAPGQNGNVAELRIYNDSNTNVEMVEGPAGPIPTASIEGQKIIEDYRRLKQEVSTGTPSNNQQTQIDNSNLAALTEVTNSQIQALDEKINTMYEANDGLQEVIIKQNETIEKMAAQIKAIQPIVKSSKELAKDLFGKNGEKTLQSRNRQIKVDTVVGDKAFFTDKDNTVYVLRVGDVVPNTSLKVIKMDESSQSVIVAY